MSGGTLNDFLLLLRLSIHLTTSRCRYGFLRMHTSCIFIFLGRNTCLFLNSARPRSGWRSGSGFRFYLATSCGRSIRDSSSTISCALPITLVTSVSLSTFLIIEISVSVSRSFSGGSAGTYRTRSSGRSSSSGFSSSVSSTSRCRCLTRVLFFLFCTV